jgi:hypothetical protein
MVMSGTALRAQGFTMPAPAPTTPALPAGCNKTSGGNPTARKGREVHREFKKEAEKKGWEAERVMEGAGGKKVRPDAYDPSIDRCKDLKPDTKSGRRRAKEKQKKYKEVLGKETDIIYYDPNTGKILWE